MTKNDELVGEITKFINGFPWGDNSEPEKIEEFANKIASLIHRREIELIENVLKNVLSNYGDLFKDCYFIRQECVEQLKSQLTENGGE